MADHSRDKLTYTRYFLEPLTPAQRHYEALRAFFVDGLPSAEAAAAFGYTPGSFRVLVHQFRQNPQREFFAPAPRATKPRSKRKRLRDRIIALRKQNLSIRDISRALAQEDEPLSPAAVAAVLKEEGFARLPRRLDEERPADTRPTTAAVADVRQFGLSPRQFRTQFGGLFLFVPSLVSAGLDPVAGGGGPPGWEMVPAGSAVRALLGLKLFGTATS